MKKLFIYLSVVMFAMAAASCQKEIGVAEGGNGNVTLTIQTPGVSTRAIADGENVNIVHYEIYKNENGHITGRPLIKDSLDMSGKEASLSLNLLQGQSYVGLFWAQVKGENCYSIADLRNVKVKYPGEGKSKTYANDESRAAFCNFKEFSTGQNVTVTLERPFAQINLGTTLESLNLDYAIVLEKSSMNVTGVSNSFNVAAMTAGIAKENIVNVAFDLATVPYAFNPSETLSADDKVWAYAGMNYVLVPGDASTTNVTYSIQTEVGTVTRNVPAVPVQKNHRTNLLGNLLTQETSINIVVDEKFAKPDYAPEGIYLAAALGGEFTLTEDITLSEPLVIQSSLKLNLNGKKITGGKEYVSGMTGNDISAIVVDNGATLTIEGEGNVNGASYGVYAKNGTLNIKGGNYSASTSAVQVGAATVNIEGGYFSNTDSDKRYTINCLDANWKNGTAKVNITGGSFYMFDPKNNAAEGTGTNFCAEGYTSMADGDVYTVTYNK